MERSHLDLSSRISGRAVVAGVVTSYAALFLLATLAGGLGFWEFNLSGPPQLNRGFWISSSVAWILSSFCGAFVAAFTGRAASVRVGMLHGLVSWANACVLGCAVVAIATGNVFGNDFSGTTPASLFGVFFGNAVAMAGALFGGRQGALYETGLAQQELERESERRLAA